VPTGTEAKASAASASPPAKLTADALKILVAEDQVVNQKVIELLLAKLNHAPKIVENGRKAVEACQAEPFDMILMDIQMPELDGVEATRAIRCLSTSNASVPIVAVTAHARAEDHDSYIGAGMNGVVAKPINLGILSGAIERHRRDRA
jgi:CheY-like chemotaxis protein